MTVHILFPWHAIDDEFRLGAIGFVRHQWRSWFPDWAQHVGSLSADSDWCKADAVELALRAADPADDDIIVIADADVWVNAWDIKTAVDAVANGTAAWAMPHRLVHRLSRRATLALADTTIDDALAVHGYDRQPYVGTVGGGMTMLTVASYRDCPLDPRFVGWGQEDESWGEALRTLLGHRHRGMADMWHLWHPPMERLATGVGNQQGVHVRSAYRRAVGDQVKMRHLVDSGRQFLID